MAKQNYNNNISILKFINLFFYKFILLPTGNVPSLTGNVPSLTGNVPSLTGNVPSPTGNVPSLTGNVSSPNGKRKRLVPPQYKTQKAIPSTGK